MEVHDCLYGKISLPGILWKIIDTKEFQRLRRIKQLGGVDYVYKDATHTRYQHSIGTAYLAGLMVDNLQSDIKDRFIKRDKNCVQIAALCHDLGHGPYSYAFRAKVLPKLGRDSSKHKELAYAIFKKIWKKIDRKDIAAEDDLTPRDMLFIKELILGTPKSCTRAKYFGREKNKWCLYQIFSNGTSQVDACKCDYMARDCLSFGNFSGELYDYLKSKKFQRVLEVIGENERSSEQLQLKYYSLGAHAKSGDIDSAKCLNDANDSANSTKCVDVCPSFQSGEDSPQEALPNKDRKPLWVVIFDLHKEIYQSADVNAVDHMIGDAIVWADDDLKISSRVQDLDFFCGLDDHILWKIRNTEGASNSNLTKAKQILKRLDEGNYYKHVRTIKVKVWDAEDIIEGIAKNDDELVKVMRISILRDEETHLQVAENAKMIQIFCVDAAKEDEVITACRFFEKSRSN